MYCHPNSTPHKKVESLTAKPSDQERIKDWKMQLAWRSVG